MFCRSPLATEIERELGPPSASMAASRPPSVASAERNDSEAFSSADSDFRLRPTPSTPAETDPLVYPLKKVAMHARKCADLTRRTRTCAIIVHTLAVFLQFIDIPTNDNGVFASSIARSRGRRLRQNVCQKSDSILLAEYRMRSRAVDARVQGGAERLARPRSRDVETTSYSTSTSRRVPGTRSPDRRALGRS